MNTLKIRKDSLHYRLASVYTLGAFCTPRDICSYTKSVIRGVMVLFLMVVLGIYVAFSSIVLPIILFLVGLNPIKDIPTGCLPGFLVVWGLGAFVLCCFSLDYIQVLWKKYANYKDRTELVESKPNFISQAYRAFKEKTCLFVEFE